MLTQRDFNDDVPSIVNANEPHMALCLLLDTSGSMMGEPIDELNSALNRFKAEVCEDKQTRDILDIAIVEFNTTHTVIQEFVPIEFMQPIQLEATGGTNMAPAIEEAIDLVNERSRFYARTSGQPYKPWIVLISDGEPTDDINAAAQRVHEMEAAQKLSLISLGVEGYNSQVLHQLSGDKVLKLNGYDFTGFLNWVGKSMRAISESAPGEKAAVPPLNESVDKDVTDWDL